MVLLYAGFALYLAALLLTCGYALVRGGTDERAAAIALFAAAAVSQVAGALGPHWSSLDFGLLAIDSVFLLVLVALAHRSTRFWPLWAAASQLVGTLTHLSITLNPSIVPEAYATAQPFWAFPILAAIAIGTKGQPAKR